MKKQVKFSVQEKHVIKSLIAYLLAQLVIISFFVYAFIDSLPIDSNEIKQADIVVDDVSFFKNLKGHWMIVYSDSSSFLFTNAFTDSEEYSVFGIENMLSKGDRLSLMYYEDITVLGKMNMVVDAKSEGVVYRSLEAFRIREKSAPFFSIVFLPVVEILFVFFAFFTISLNKKEIKRIWKKTIRGLFCD